MTNTGKIGNKFQTLFTSFQKLMYTTSIVLFLLEFVIYYHSNHSQQAGSKPREFDAVPSFTHAASISELGRDP
jgi:hypothetical protein